MTFFFCVLLVDTQSPQCNTLIYFYMVAYNTGLTNHHTSSMVYAKMLTDLCSRMNVNTGIAMRMLRDDPRNSLNTFCIQLVCNPIGCDGVKARIGSNYFPPALGRRITLIHSSNVILQFITYGW